MAFWTAYAFFIFSSLEAFASETTGHHASPADLVAPAINVSILFGVLIWKLKGPLKAHFIQKSQDISNTLQRASLKSKEAQMMLDAEERKAANVLNEIKNISTQSEKDIAHFEKNLSRETEDKAHKLKTDANLKIAADKKSMMDELNSELLSQVIMKTKSTIKTNKDYQTKVSSKLLQGL